MLLVVVMVFEYACLSLWLVSMGLQNSSIQMFSPRFAPSSIRFWTSRAKDTRIYGPDDSSFQHTSSGSRVRAEASDLNSNFFFSNLCHVTCWFLIHVLHKIDFFTVLEQSLLNIIDIIEPLEVCKSRCFSERD